MRTEAPIMSCYHLCVAAPGAQSRLLDDVSIEIDRGSWNEIVGASGCGKTVLFSLLSLRARPDEGKLVVNGRNFDRLSARGVADLRRRFASCAQVPRLLDDRTVIENLVLPFVVRGEREVALEQCEKALEDAEIAHLRDVTVRGLSHQNRLVVGLVRALAGQPSLIVVDGVLEQLEEQAHRHMLALLRNAHMRGAAVVLLGRGPSENARRGKRWDMAEGRLSEAAAPPRPRTPETGGPLR